MGLVTKEFRSLCRHGRDYICRQYTRWQIRKETLPSIGIGFGHAPGDDLLLTPIIRALVKREPNHTLWVFSNYPEFFRELPSVLRVFPFDAREPRRWLSAARIACHTCEYTSGDLRTDSFTVPSRHIVAEMAFRLGLRGEIDVVPRFDLTESERLEMSWARNTVVVSPSGLAKRLPMINKEWYFHRFQEVRDRFPDVAFVQVGDAADPLLERVRDCRGVLSIPQTTSLLANARCFLGQVGFLMHLARAVECPAVIVYGGREKPWQSGYQANSNVSTDLPCSPCWKYNSCDFGQICMHTITVDTVENALRTQLRDGRSRRMGSELVNIE